MSPRNDWLFDLGNSRLKFAALSSDGAIGRVEARAHDGAGWRDALPSGGTAWICSVASAALRQALLDALAPRFREVSIARTSAACAGVRIAYARPADLGVDRFLALLGARALGADPCLVVGVGTALTIDLLDAGGRHLGGRIAPSPTVMREALHARAGQLPVDGGTYVEFADGTRDALASGCEGAALGLVGRSLDHARELLGRDAVPLLHGGGAAALVRRIDGARIAPALVLQGLAAWANAGDRHD